MSESFSQSVQSRGLIIPISNQALKKKALPKKKMSARRKMGANEVLWIF